MARFELERSNRDNPPISPRSSGLFGPLWATQKWFSAAYTLNFSPLQLPPAGSVRTNGRTAHPTESFSYFRTAHHHFPVTILVHIVVMTKKAAKFCLLGSNIHDHLQKLFIPEESTKQKCNQFSSFFGSSPFPARQRGECPRTQCSDLAQELLHQWNRYGMKSLFDELNLQLFVVYSLSKWVQRMAEHECARHCHCMYAPLFSPATTQ